MRSIKFRAWDNLAKTMLELVTVGCTRKDKWNPLYIQDGFINGIDHSDYIVMQHTGLTDKNGKEIYEGDVYHMGDPNITYTVVWHDTGLIGKQNGASSYVGLSHWQRRIEVIGNRFEHPHLLEEFK